MQFMRGKVESFDPKCGAPTTGRRAIYTIGHSNLEPAEFIKLLKQHCIEALIDVRSKPFSAYASRYNRAELKELCRENGVRYFFMGDSLGGRPEDESVFRNGEIDYALLSRKDYFLSGVDKLIGLAAGSTVCVMCSEGRPDQCHRNLLITPELEKRGVQVLHILPEGRAISGEELRLELNHGQLSLF